MSTQAESGADDVIARSGPSGDGPSGLPHTRFASLLVHRNPLVEALLFLFEFTGDRFP